MKLWPIIKVILIFKIIFFLGWVSASLYSDMHQNPAASIAVPDNIEYANGIEYTKGIFLSDFFSLFNNAKNLNIEKPSPSDHIPLENIHVYSDRVIIDLPGPSWSEFEWSVFANSNSMDPLLDTTANGIEIKPLSPSQLSAGDVVSFKAPGLKNPIIHRIIKTGYDKQGWYALTKGDNNVVGDNRKIRFENITGLLVGVIY